MSRSVDELLASQTRKKEASQGILCYLFRDALIWKVPDKPTWLRKMRSFMQRPHNAKNDDLGNLNKALTQDNLTWGSFVKAVDFLNPQSATLRVCPRWQDGRESEYIILIDPAMSDYDDTPTTVPTDMGDNIVANSSRIDGSKPNKLASLYRQILIKENIDQKKWESLLKAWVDDPRQPIKNGRQQRNEAITMLNRDLLRSKMTWECFRKGIQVLAPATECYVLDMDWGDVPIRPKTTHRWVQHDPRFVADRIMAERLNNNPEKAIDDRLRARDGKRINQRIERALKDTSKKEKGASDE